MTATELQGASVELDTVDEADADAKLTKDQIFHLLQNERRRSVLRYLQDCDGKVRMRDVAEQVAAWEHDTTVVGLSSDERQRVYIPLYQNHLPKLDDEGIIDYDQSRGIVERLPLADQLDPYLCTEETEADDGATEEEETPWESYYLGASGLGVAVLGGSALNLSLFSALSGLAIGTFILMLFSALTVGQFVSNSS